MIVVLLMSSLSYESQCEYLPGRVGMRGRRAEADSRAATV